MGRVMHGARAKLGILSPSTNTIRFIGIIESISYGMTFDVQPSFVLGRWTCASLDYTSVEPIQINMTGYRVVDHGPHADGQLPKIQDLLNSDYCTIIVVDRQTLKEIAIIQDVRISGFTGGFAARQLSQLSISAVGTLVSDESTDNSEPADSTVLP